MSYEKQTWATGDTVTAEKLNHMEDGIAAAASGGGSSNVLIVHPTLGTGTEGGWPVTAIDETYEKIRNADMAYAEVYASDLGGTFKLPLVFEQTTPNYEQLTFSASAGYFTALLTLSFSASTQEFDASASAFTVR